MIIDVSNTLGRHRFRPEIKAEELLKEIDKNHIDMAVTHYYGGSMDSESVYKAVTGCPDQFINFYTINPWSADSAKEFEEASKEKGFKGLYMDPVRHGYMLCGREVFYLLLDVCRKHQMPVWCCGTAEVFFNPVFFGQIAEDYPDVNIIMGRMGPRYDNAGAVMVGKCYKNVFLETSSSMDFNTLRVMKTAGIDQVLLRTGTPDAGFYELELAKMRKATVSFPDGEEKVLWKNAARIFRIGEMDQMIIDTLAHIGIKGGGDYHVESLIRVMDQSDEDKCMICFQLETVNSEYIHESVQKFPEGTFGLAITNPWDIDGEEQLEGCFRDYHFYGLKMNATRFGYSADRHSLLDPYFELCCRYDKCVVVHGQSDMFSVPDKWTQMVKGFPDMPVVLSHMGVPLMYKKAIELAGETPNFYLSAAGAYVPMIQMAYDRLGPEKMLFSLDAPFYDQTQEMDKIRYMTKNEEHLEMMLGKNAARIMGIEYR